MYKGVIEEVIKNVRNDFVNMGVDEQVLYDLQMVIWKGYYITLLIPHKLSLSIVYLVMGTKINGL